MEEYYSNNQRSVRLGVIYAVLVASLWEGSTITFKVDKKGRDFMSITGLKMPFDWTHSCDGQIKGAIKSLVVYRTTKGYSLLVNADAGRWIGKRAHCFQFRLIETRKGVTAWAGKGFTISTFLGSFPVEELWLRQAFKNNS